MTSRWHFGHVMKITAITTDCRRVPLGKPTRVPLSELASSGPDAIDVVLVHLATDEGITGLGFTLTLGSGAGLIRAAIDSQLSPLVLGHDPRDVQRLFTMVEARLRPLGFVGLMARAYAAIDLALWDAKARGADLPLFQLLGNARASAPYFVSDAGLSGRSAADIIKTVKPLMKQGATGVRVVMGGGDVQAEAERIRDISDGLGDEAWVGVAANGRFDLGTAQALSNFFEDIGIDWFEDPLPGADEPGYVKLANLMEVPLAIGSSFDTPEEFYRVIRAGIVRIVRPDPMRLGGITPVLKIATVAEAYHVSVVPVRMPEVGVHLACGLGNITHVDSVGWLASVFTGGPSPANGHLIPPREPGLGLTVGSQDSALRP